MGNCQAAEAATAVVQHPGGRVERLYWATSAAEVMRANPGHYVALVTLRVAEEKRPPPTRERTADRERRGTGTVRVTRVKLLKPRDTLLLGQAYRLITVDEVTRALQAKEEKSRKAAQQQQHPESKLAGAGARINSGGDDHTQLDETLDQHDRDIQRSSSVTHSRHRQWRPSLHSIAEVRLN